MSDLLDSLKQRFRSANIVEQLIYINIIVFLIAFIIKAISNLMQFGENPVFDWFSLPATSDAFFSKPWTIISYGFLHGDFLHILFNLVLLYYLGNLFLDFFSKKDFLIYYFVGIIVGGIFYMISYNFFPALQPDNSFLVGASAGVTAILIGLATKIPNYGLSFRFIGRIKLWYIALAFIALDIIQIAAINNTGGHLAHLGGALVGYLFTTFGTNTSNTSKGKGFKLGDIFTSKKRKPLKTVYKKSKPTSNSSYKDAAHQRKIDTILDKISKSGYDALTKEEKDFLFSISKKDQ